MPYVDTIVTLTISDRKPPQEPVIMSRADSAIAEKKGHCLLIAGVIIFGLLLCTVLHFNYRTRANIIRVSTERDVPGQKIFLVPVSLCPGTRAGANVPGRPGTK